MPEVSVIIPIYNTAAYLRKALDSICGQTLKELEIILIDDGSTDGSRGIIEEYAKRDARIRWYAQPNQGLSVARNRGLLHATGKYIYFMDSDDILDTQALRHCHDLCEKRELDFIFFDAKPLTESADSQNIPNYDRISNSNYLQSEASGAPTVYTATELKSKIVSGYLESSNVQAADEMVNMIIAQRAYEMNSKAITASDEMLQQANNLRS